MPTFHDPFSVNADFSTTAGEFDITSTTTGIQILFRTAIGNPDVISISLSKVDAVSFAKAVYKAAGGATSQSKSTTKATRVGTKQSKPVIAKKTNPPTTRPVGRG